ANHRLMSASCQRKTKHIADSGLIVDDQDGAHDACPMSEWPGSGSFGWGIPNEIPKARSIASNFRWLSNARSAARVAWSSSTTERLGMGYSRSNHTRARNAATERHSPQITCAHTLRDLVIHATNAADIGPLRLCGGRSMTSGDKQVE